MTRYSTLLALLALPALVAACDAPKSPLAKAKPGECYTVVGRDSLGKPTLAKTPCAASPDVLAAACPPPLTTPPVGCPPAGAPGTAAGATGKTKTTVGQTSRNVATRMAQRGRSAFRQATTRQASRTTNYRSTQRYARNEQRQYGQGEVFRDYQRVYTPDRQELYGAPPPRQDFHAEGGFRHGGQAYREEYRAEHHAPPPRGYAHREEYREGHAYARPLPPPPPRHDGYAYREERREHYSPPPREYAYEEERYAEHRAPKRRSGAAAGYSARQVEGRSAYSYRESSSSSSSYSSHGSSHGGGCCRPGGHALPPSPFDQNGYLTWRGKTPG